MEFIRLFYWLIIKIAFREQLSPFEIDLGFRNSIFLTLAILILFAFRPAFCKVGLQFNYFLYLFLLNAT